MTEPRNKAELKRLSIDELVKLAKWKRSIKYPLKAALGFLFYADSFDNNLTNKDYFSFLFFSVIKTSFKSISKSLL